MRNVDRMEMYKLQGDESYCVIDTLTRRTEEAWDF